MALDADDRAEVAAQVAKYNRAFDHNRVDDFVDTFTPDGVFVSKDGTVAEGHDGIRSWFAGREHNTVHVTTDATLEEGDDGLVHHRCTIMVFRRRGDGFVLGSLGEYDDTVKRTAAGWRFSRRAPVTHPVYPAPG